jgi:secreted trypsin-like serine protease
MWKRNLGACILALALAGCQADPAGTVRPHELPEAVEATPPAIVGGFVDEQNSYGNVGAFLVQRPSDGWIFPICSGTLIGHDVFLTAGHCAIFYLADLAPAGFTAHVSFNNPIGWAELTDLGSITVIDVTQVIVNPAFGFSQDDTGDLAVLLLSEAAVGTVPATLPPAGLLDQLAAQKALRNASFTAVGYGVQERVVGGGPPFFGDSNPEPRRYSFPSFNALNPAWLRLSQNSAKGDGGTCFGDSGGPNFVDAGGTQILVATTVKGDVVCRATNVVHRLDTSAARAFLANFVELP